MDGALDYRQVSSWDTDEVIKWMNGLQKCLEAHIPQFLAHCICGADLLKMSHQQLEYLKVTQIGHQELLLEAVELLSALEKGRTHDFTLSLASDLSKKTSQLIKALSGPSTTSSTRKKHVSSEDAEADRALSRVEITSAVMTAAKHLLSWLDRNPSNHLEDYDRFRTEVLQSALDLSSVLMNDYDTSQMLESCRAILKCTAVMMSPQILSSVEPIKLLTVPLQPDEHAGLGFSIQRTRQGNLVVNHVVPGSPAGRTGKVVVGVEIVQINHQNVVGWEIGKVMETLKASGHEVSLVINAGNKSKEIEENSDPSPPQSRTNGSEDTQLPPAQPNDSCDSPSSLANAEPLTNTSQSTTSDLLSSSQDTLDDIADSPASFEGDTDFSGMEKLLVKGRLPIDLQRTSSAPLIEREKLRGLEASDESGLSSVDSRAEEKRILSNGETSSLEGVDGGRDSVGGGSSKSPHDLRLQQRTASDGTVEKGKKSDKGPKQHHLPPVAYRTQVIGGVVVRIPIKPEEQERSNQKRQRNSRQRARVKKGGKSGGEGASEGGGVAGDVPPSPVEQTPPDGDEGLSDKGRAVFSECKEVTIGGHTTKQVTVSSNPEVVGGGGKKSSNPALLVPCFQLKNAQKEGFMCKMGGSGLTPKNWRRRWFVLKDKKLYYYKTSYDVSALGIVDMVGYSLELSSDPKKKHAFKAVRQGARTYYFQAESAEDMTSWMECLREATVPDDEHGLMDSPTTIEASDDEL